MTEKKTLGSPRADFGLPPCFSCEKEPQVYIDGLCEKCHKIACGGSDKLKEELIQKKIANIKAPPFKKGDWITFSEAGISQATEFPFIVPGNKRVWQAEELTQSIHCGSGYLYRGYDSSYYRRATPNEAKKEGDRLARQVRQINKRINRLDDFANYGNLTEDETDL